MTKTEAAYVADKYMEHCGLLALARTCQNKKDMKYHTGCIKMALQIFEQFNESHGFGSPKGALEWRKTQ